VILLAFDFEPREKTELEEIFAGVFLKEFHLVAEITGSDSVSEAS
jgi:hypothetical protein